MESMLMSRTQRTKPHKSLHLYQNGEYLQRKHFCIHTKEKYLNLHKQHLNSDKPKLTQSSMIPSATKNQTKEQKAEIFYESNYKKPNQKKKKNCHLSYLDWIHGDNTFRIHHKLPQNQSQISILFNKY